MAEALRFPDYFRMNWDALDECLHDFVVEPTEVVWTHSDRYARADPEGFTIVQSCFATPDVPVSIRLA